MKIYIVQGYGGKNGFFTFSKITNLYIKIIPINTILYRGFECFRFLFYKKGLSCPPILSVVILAIYVGINSGYSQLFLHGVDHNFFNTLYVNDKNQLCCRRTYFYNNEEELTPVIRSDNGKIYQVWEYLDEYKGLFYSHELCAQYAKYMGVRIINNTNNSMIDSYERRIKM
jgi:hypothetical protein